MQAMIDKGDDVEAIAAHHFTTPAVVRQRLKLAAVSPKLHGIYADDGMTLDQLMAFTVADDHQRQEEVWTQLDHSFNRSEEHTSELQSLMRISYAVFCLKKKKNYNQYTTP